VALFRVTAPASRTVFKAKSAMMASVLSVQSLVSTLRNAARVCPASTASVA
jgi:hypothetical protein